MNALSTESSDGKSGISKNFKKIKIFLKKCVSFFEFDCLLNRGGKERKMKIRKKVLSVLCAAMYLLGLKKKEQ